MNIRTEMTKIDNLNRLAFDMNNRLNSEDCINTEEFKLMLKYEKLIKKIKVLETKLNNYINN